MKMTVFWVDALCCLGKVHRRFRRACCLIALMMEAASTSETSVNLYQTTRRNNPEERHLSTNVENQSLLQGRVFIQKI
jgi:hypothetical protein